MKKAAWLLSAMTACGGMQAAEGAEQCERRAEPSPTISFRIDNDLVGGQDQGYTNGAQLGFVSANLLDYTDESCMSGLTRWMRHHLSGMPEDFDQQNMLFTMNHAMYTPEDYSRRDLIQEDRPYVGALLLSVGYNARSGNHLRTMQLVLGMIGPSAKGRQLQNAAHNLFGSEKFLGWDHQLRDEPILNLLYERMYRFGGKGASVWGWDAISHYGGALGNYATSANGGLEVRFGRHLPDDFGSTPLRPAGENTAPASQTQPGGVWRVHGFLTSDMRWVLQDITLDGNTWKNSHSVDKRPLVAYIGYGLALMKGRWKFSLARYHSTREFDGQLESPVFGSFTMSRML